MSSPDWSSRNICKPRLKAVALSVLLPLRPVLTLYHKDPYGVGGRGVGGLNTHNKALIRPISGSIVS